MKNDFLEEIKDVEEPKNFQNIDVSNIVKKYIPKSSSRQEIEDILENHGFKVFSIEKYLLKEYNFIDCDHEISIGVLEFRNTFSLFPTHRLIVKVGYKKELSEVVTGIYTKNMF